MKNSLFDALDSIWTFNCPCPSSPKQHASHVCRFKHTPAATVLTEQFGALCSAFYEEPRTTKGYVVEPAVPFYTTHPEFNILLDIYGLKLCRKDCLFGHGCRNPYDCAFAHTIDEMLLPFKDQRVRRFYREVAQIKDPAYKPHTTIMAVNESSKFKCPSLGCIETEVNTKLVYHTPSLLIYPYIVIECRQCRRVTNTAVYR